MSAPQPGVIEAARPDPDMVAAYMHAVFGYCEGWVPIRALPEKGAADQPPHTPFIQADRELATKTAAQAVWAADAGMALYAVPGTVATPGEAKADDIVQTQVVVVDLDHGDIAAKRDHLVRHLGDPSLEVDSGGITAEGQPKRHLYWRLTEPAEGDDIAIVCRLRHAIAVKAGGDPVFRSAHQPIRIAGSVYQKGGKRRLVRIAASRKLDYDLTELAEAVMAMPPLEGAGGHELDFNDAGTGRGPIEDVFRHAVREGGIDGVTRFESLSRIIGYWIRRCRQGQVTRAEAWDEIADYNDARIDPPWPIERLQAEAERLWRKDEERHGPIPEPATPAPHGLPTFSLGEWLDDQSPMPPDIIGPRLLTPGGLLVLGGAPKVGKSDFVISLLAHAAAGVPFLGFAPPRPLRVFYLQAEIQYHYLRERFQNTRLPDTVLAAARDNLIATPKVKMLLDANGVPRTVEAIQARFADQPPDVICIDPIRNLFDGGDDDEGKGENSNNGMLFFLQERVEVLRETVCPDLGIILCHHTKKITKKLLAEDPFQALSGASSLRSFYTSGVLMCRPDEERPERKLFFELRNGPGIEPRFVDKVDGQWVEIDRRGERLVRREHGAKLDAERRRKHDVILQLLYDEALEGRVYTANQFVERFENQAGLGSRDTVRDRLSVLSTKGYVKFFRDYKAYNLPGARSPYGYMCVEGMQFGPAKETTDADTGEVVTTGRQVLPTHYKCPLSGAVLPVENPKVWVYLDGDQT